jgi:hypothetical protein
LKKILILYPHFPPSNLAGIHRPRLFAQHLPSFGWEPTILTIDEKYYEEALDHDLAKLLPKDLRVEKVNAFHRKGPIGDIGLRGFLQLYKKAKSMIKAEGFDFLYIPIPSFYCALLGRMLHGSTGIRYGIDYIDPWVHSFPGSEKKFSRHWWSTKLARMLEPIAVKKASLITGVAEGYYNPVLERNPQLKNAVTGAMPYGGEALDHKRVEELHLKPYLFNKKPGKLQMVYAGAMLPKAFGLLDLIFKAISENREVFEEVEFHFIGTGRLANDENSGTVKPYAEKHGLWQNIVFEYPKRIPYLSVLVHLSIADGVFILGSTEPHYTPSKSYQAVLSHKPVLAVLHAASSAVGVIRNAHAGVVLSFNGEEEAEKAGALFTETFLTWLDFKNSFDPEKVDMQEFNKFSAYEVTKTLAGLLDKTQLS